MTRRNMLYAGVAKSDITTSDRTDVNDPLYAKALVLDDGNTRTATISMDTTAIGGRRIGAGMLDDVGEDFLPSLRHRVENELTIPGCNVMVSATHTHPAGRLLCDDAQQVERVFDAVSRAAASMVPVKVGCGKGYEDRISMNRTLRMKDGSHWPVRHAYPCPPNDKVAELGPVDYEIGIIRIDRYDGNPLAVVYNFACHPLIGVPGGGITAGYPGFASKVIEENLDGATAIFLQGAAGDVCELLYKDVNAPRNCETGGMLLGLSTLNALKDIKTGDAKLGIIREKMKLPKRTDIPAKIESLIVQQNELLKSLRFTSLNLKTFLPLYIRYALDSEYPADYSYRYKHAAQRGSNELTDVDAVNHANIEKYLDNIHVMERLSKIQDDIETLKKHQGLIVESPEPAIDAEIMGIKIGDCVLITSPAEVLTQVGLNVKNDSPYEHTFVAAYSNGYVHYGPPSSDYDKGGYEVTECLLAPQWQEVFEITARKIIGKL